MKHSVLCIGGGGFRLCAKLGAMKHDHRLQDINTYVGVSMGAVLCLFLALGYSVDEIYEYFTNTSISWERDSDIFAIHQTYGVFTLENLYKEIERMIFQKLNMNDPTIGDIEKQYHKKVYICSWNLTKQTLEYHTDTTPIKMAILMTTAIPFCLHSISYKDHIHIDVGLLKGSSYVFNELLERKLFRDEDTLCYQIVSDSSVPNKYPGSFFEFIQQVLLIAFQSLGTTKTKIKETKYIRLSNKYPYIPIDLSESERLSLCKEMWKIGYNQIKKKN